MTTPRTAGYDPWAILLTWPLFYLLLHGMTTCISVDKGCDSSVSAEEKAWLLKLCTREALIYNQTVFPYPGNVTNFLICTDVQTGCPGHCPPWHIFEPSTKKCFRQPTTIPRINICPLAPGTNVSVAERPWPQSSYNPCKHMPDGECYYLENRLSRTSYIMCVPFNWPTYRLCLRGLVWRQKYLRCEPPRAQTVSCEPGSVNHCRQLINQMDPSEQQLYFPCKGNGTYFMECNLKGERLINKCQTGYVWIHSEYRCDNFF